jgi:hypothetical protein
MPDVNLKRKPKISFAPLRSVGAFTDIDTGDIFISQYQFVQGKAASIAADELAHITCANANHSNEWEVEYLRLFGKLPIKELFFDANRRRLGIPDNIAANIGNISGIQNILTDYTLLQQYRRFSQRVLGNEGHWEVLGDNKIRLYPTPKGSFPVVMLYVPAITTWRTPANKMMAMDMLLAETMIMLGNARGKFASIPGPDGGAITLNGADLVQRGMDLREKVLQDALLLTDDPQAAAIYRY